MAGNDVTFTVSAKAGAAVQTFNRLISQAEKLDAVMAALGSRPPRINQQSSSMFGSLFSNLGKAAIAFTGLGSALGSIAMFASRVRAEYERMKEVRQYAQAGIHSTQKAMSQLLPMFEGGNISQGNRENMTRLMQLAGYSDPAVLINILRSVLSARDPSMKGMSDEDILKYSPKRGGGGIIQTAIELTRTYQDPELASDIAGGMTDVISAMQARGYSDMSNQEISAMLFAAFREARPTDTPEFMRAFLPSVTQAVRFGGKAKTGREALASAFGFAASMSQLTADQLGRKSPKDITRVRDRFTEIYAELTQPVRGKRAVIPGMSMADWHGMDEWQKMNFVKSNKYFRAAVLGLKGAMTDEDIKAIHDMRGDKYGLDYRAGASGEMGTMEARRAFITDDVSYNFLRDKIYRLVGTNLTKLYEELSTNADPMMRSARMRANMQGYLGARIFSDPDILAKSAQMDLIEFSDNLRKLMGTSALESDWGYFTDVIKAGASNRSPEETARLIDRMAGTMADKVFDKDNGRIDNWLLNSKDYHSGKISSGFLDYIRANDPKTFARLQAGARGNIAGQGFLNAELFGSSAERNALFFNYMKSTGDPRLEWMRQLQALSQGAREEMRLGGVTPDPERETLRYFRETEGGASTPFSTAIDSVKSLWHRAADFVVTIRDTYGNDATKATIPASPAQKLNDKPQQRGGFPGGSGF